MTVGAALATRTGLRLFHITARSTSSCRSSRLVVRHWPSHNFSSAPLLEEVASSDSPGLIFTYVWAFDQANDDAEVEAYSAIFKQRGGAVYYVELQASQAVRLQRNQTEFRLAEKPFKRDLVESRRQLIALDDYQLDSGSRFEGRADYLRIDNTDLSPEDVPDKISRNLRTQPALVRGNDAALYLSRFSYHAGDLGEADHKPDGPMQGRSDVIESVGGELQCSGTPSAPMMATPSGKPLTTSPWPQCFGDRGGGAINSPQNDSALNRRRTMNPCSKAKQSITDRRARSPRSSETSSSTALRSAAATRRGAPGARAVERVLQSVRAASRERYRVGARTRSAPRRRESFMVRVMSASRTLSRSRSGDATARGAHGRERLDSTDSSRLSRSCSATTS